MQTKLSRQASRSAPFQAGQTVFLSLERADGRIDFQGKSGPAGVLRKTRWQRCFPSSNLP